MTTEKKMKFHANSRAIMQNLDRIESDAGKISEDMIKTMFDDIRILLSANEDMALED